MKKLIGRWLWQDFVETRDWVVMHLVNPNAGALLFLHMTHGHKKID